MSVSMESKKIKTTKDHILNSKILQSLEQQEEKKKQASIRQLGQTEKKKDHQAGC